MDPNMYWANMAGGQAIQYSAVSCQMTSVRPATTWATSVNSYPANMMPYPHARFPGPQMSVHQPAPPGTLPVTHPTQLIAQHMFHSQHELIPTISSASSVAGDASLPQQNPPVFLMPPRPPPHPMQPSMTPPRPSPFFPPSPFSSSASFESSTVTESLSVPLPSSSPGIKLKAAVVTPSKHAPMMHTLASKLAPKLTLSSRDTAKEKAKHAGVDFTSLTTAARPLKAEKVSIAQSPTRFQGIAEADKRLCKNIYRKYEALFIEHGPMEPSDQKVCNVFIKLSNEERQLVAACRSIKSFLCVNPAFVYEDKVIHFDESARSDSPEPEDSEELFALKAYKAGITVEPPKSKSCANLTPRIPGDGQSDPAAEIDSDSQDSIDEFDSDESLEGPCSDQNFAKSCMTFLQEEDDHNLHEVMDTKNRVIATKTSSLSKTRIEDVSDMMNNFCAIYGNNNNDDLSQQMGQITMRDRETDSVGENDSVPGTPDYTTAPRLRRSSSKLNVHCTEFVPRSPGLCDSGDAKVGSSKLSSSKVSPDVSTVTSRVKTKDVATSTLGLTYLCHTGTMTVFTPCHKCVQTDRQRKQMDDMVVAENLKVDEAEYEEVLYRAMMAEERVLHLQRDLNVMRAKFRIQEFEALLPLDRAKSSISFINKEISRIEAMCDSNLSAVRDGVKLAELPPLVLKPLPTTSTNVAKAIDPIDAKVETTETDSLSSYFSAKSDQAENDTDEMEKAAATEDEPTQVDATNANGAMKLNIMLLELMANQYLAQQQQQQQQVLAGTHVPLQGLQGAAGVPGKPPGLPIPDASASNSQGPPDITAPEKREMAGVLSAPSSARKGRGRGRGYKKSNPPGVGAVKDTVPDDSRSIASDQNSASVFKFGNSGSSEFTFRKNVKRVAMTRREKAVEKAVTNNVSEGSKRKIQDIQDKVDGWDVGSVLLATGDAEPAVKQTDPASEEMNSSRKSSVVEDYADARSSASLGYARSSTSPEYVTPPPAPVQEINYTPEVRRERKASEEDWDDEEPDYNASPWKLSTFGPIILPMQDSVDESNKPTGLPPGLPPKITRNKTKAPPNSLAAKLQQNEKNKTESNANPPPPPAAKTSGWRGKQLPIVASSINTVPVVLNKGPAKSQSAVQEKRPKPTNTKPEPKEKEKEKSAISALDSFDVNMPPKPENEDNEWHQVCKKKKKSDSPAPKPQPVAASQQADKKSHEIFDKLIQKILGLHTHLNRNDVIDIISEVRQMKGGLNGMKLSQILDAATAVISARKKNQPQIEYTGPVLMSHEIALDVAEVLYKSELCQYWLNGHCQKGESCLYAHGKDELRSSPKYILCSNFESGHCIHGTKCLYAHGKKELQVPPADFNLRSRKKSGSAGNGSPADAFSGPAAAAALDPFPKRLQPVEDFTTGEPCVICCGGIRPGLEEKLTCGHSFHQICIKRWVVGEERTCPTCRSHVLLEEEFPSLG